jgi:hypothetical protein
MLKKEEGELAKFYEPTIMATPPSLHMPRHYKAKTLLGSKKQTQRLKSFNIKATGIFLAINAIALTSKYFGRSWQQMNLSDIF